MITPIFQISDYQQARDFYLDWLGFKIDWEDRGSKGIYLQVSRGDIILHLSSYVNDCCPGAKAIAEMKGLLTYQHFLAQKKQPFVCPELKKTNWSDKVVQTEVTDPFGNRIVFVEACM
ncbi:MAG TPA: glyoxalase superfamily protein [Hymenobacter sp.]|jgi:catechol-2,3-dioxygenase|uniref:glyoxalase superfamily protein n=1 Tax=Hymenobacter sp. TaxID=1898978 RepID=UPI002ED82540